MQMAPREYVHAHRSALPTDMRFPAPSPEVNHHCAVTLAVTTTHTLEMTSCPHRYLEAGWVGWLVS